MNPHIRALWRFRLVLVLGLAVALLAAIAIQYRIDFSNVPPALTERNQPTYLTTARILVTSPDVPYLRISVTRAPVAATGEAASAAAAAAVAPPVEERPDLGILVRAANLYPLLITSDEVRRIRDEMFGPLPGNVTAQGIFSIANPNRFEPTTLPVIELVAGSDSAKGAIDLAQGTVDAFRRYIRGQQDRAKLKADERILLQQLQEPRSALASGGGSLGLPVLVAFALLAAFGALALLLDRLFPSERRQPGAPVEQLGHRMSVSDTA